MPGERSSLRRKHTEPFFWYYACACITIAAGFFIWLVELLQGEWSPEAGVGLVAMLIGLWGLSSAENRQLKRRVAELEKSVGVSSGEQDTSTSN